MLALDKDVDPTEIPENLATCLSVPWVKQRWNNVLLLRLQNSLLQIFYSKIDNTRNYKLITEIKSHMNQLSG